MFIVYLYLLCIFVQLNSLTAVSCLVLWFPETAGQVLGPAAVGGGLAGTGPTTRDLHRRREGRDDRRRQQHRDGHIHQERYTVQSSWQVGTPRPILPAGRNTSSNTTGLAGRNTSSNTADR